MKKIEFHNKTILITGAAGFIGSFLAKRICSLYPSSKVIGFDNLCDYYDVSLKEYRLNELKEYTNFSFIKGDLCDKGLLDSLFIKYSFDIVVNLAAQAGVRYSIDHPDSYIESNVVGFYNILEMCRKYPVLHLVFASSSSVYGESAIAPFSTEQKADSPVSLYAATKRCDELIAYSYSKLYNIPCTGLRFFTVYGPCGRPDMAYFSFTEKLVHGEKLSVFHNGECLRDFTYIDDVVEGILRVMKKTPQTHYALYNIGNSHPVKLIDFIHILVQKMILYELLPKDFDLSSHMEFLPLQPGDVSMTYADVTPLQKNFGFCPNTNLEDGLDSFIQWYKSFYQ